MSFVRTIKASPPRVAPVASRPRQIPSFASLVFRRRLPIAATFLAAIAGCSGESGPARFDISGRVTYGGKPVPIGQIQFEPDASQGNRGPAGSAAVESGSYDTAKAGVGHVGGPHHVLIVGYDGIADPESELFHGQPLFEAYRITVDLPREAGVRDFDVPPDHTR